MVSPLLPVEGEGAEVLILDGGTSAARISGNATSDKHMKINWKFWQKKEEPTKLDPISSITGPLGGFQALPTVEPDYKAQLEAARTPGVDAITLVKLLRFDPYGRGWWRMVEKGDYAGLERDFGMTINQLANEGNQAKAVDFENAFFSGFKVSGGQ